MADNNNTASGTKSHKIAVISDKPRPSNEELVKTFSTEQLPQLDESEGHQASSSEVTGKSEAAQGASETRQGADEASLLPTAGEPPIGKERPLDEKGQLLPEKVDLPPDDNSAMKFLKPPKGSKEEVKGKKGSLDTFDYAGFSTEETDILKNMPVGNRSKVGNLLKENKELAKLKDTQFYQHENGYVLHPGYQSEVQAVNLADREARIWAKQLESVKKGEAIKPLQGWDANGNPVYGAEIAANDILEEQIRGNMNDCLSVVKSKRGEIEQFVKNFKSVTETDSKLINDERTKRFAWVADPKLMDYSVTCDDGTERPIKQIRSDIINLLPSYRRSSIEANLVGDMMVALVIARAELNEFKKGKGSVKVKEEEAEHIEPSGEVKPKKVSGAVNGVKTFSMSGFTGDGLQ